jgi:hypothetical protein
MPPSIQGLDSFGPITEPAARAAAEAGILVWGRYLYNLGPNEIAIGHDHGIGVLLIGEHDTRTHHPVHDGYSAGYAHGQADRMAAIALGAPQGVGIGLMATADDKVFDGADEIALGAYMDGYRDGIAGPFEHCLYGGAGPVLWCREQGHVTAATWVAGASYWNNGIDPAAAQAQMHQLAAPAVNYGGTNCDLNELYDLEGLCAWMPEGSHPHPPPTPTPAPRGGAMEIFKFPDKDDLFLYGIDRDGEWCIPVPTTDAFDPVLLASLPARLLASGDDALDERFHRLTGL